MKAQEIVDDIITRCTEANGKQDDQTKVLGLYQGCIENLISNKGLTACSESLQTIATSTDLQLALEDKLTLFEILRKLKFW